MYREAVMTTTAELFGFESTLDVPVLADGEHAGHVPELDEAYRFDPAVTSAILAGFCLLYTSPSPRDGLLSRMPSSA